MKIQMLASAACMAAAAVSVTWAQFASVAWAQSVDWLARKAAQPVVLSKVLEEGGRARVIVELVDPPQLAVDSDSPAARTAVAHLQTAVLRAAFGDIRSLGAANSRHALHRMTAFPMFVITVSRAELERLAADARVLRITPDGRGHAGLNQSTKQIGMPQAWAAPLRGDGRNRSVAILDSGVDLDHQFIGRSRILAQACFSGGGSTVNTMCPNGKTSQTTGDAGVNCPLAWASDCAHGTHVAGIAAGFNTEPSGAEPRRGVAIRAEIIAVQIATKPTPLGGAWTTFWSDNIAALDWLYSNRNTFAAPLAAINMSVWDSSIHRVDNCDAQHPAFKSAIDRLRRKGISTVIISGNGSHENGVSVPGCISTAFTVSATTKTIPGKPELIASYANMGKGVDVLAPGGDFPYPYPAGFRGGIDSSILGGFFQHFEGTSMAAPHVVGAIAVIRSVKGCGDIDLRLIERALRVTGKPVHDQRSGGMFTRRRIAVDAAIEELNCATAEAVAEAEAAESR